MLSVYLRRRYRLPLVGRTGLDALHQHMLQCLDMHMSHENVLAAISSIPAFQHIVGTTPVQTVVLPAGMRPAVNILPDATLRKKYGIPPPTDYRSLHPGRIAALAECDRLVRMHEDDVIASSSAAGWKRYIAGILGEQQFVLAWTHNGFKQPGVKLVRPATEHEDNNEKVDAVMELVNGSSYRFQVKVGSNGSFMEHALKNVVLVRCSPQQPAEKIRATAIAALLRFNEFWKSQPSQTALSA